MTELPTQLKILLSILFAMPGLFALSCIWGLDPERSNWLLGYYYRYWLALPLAGMLLSTVVKA